MGAKPQPAAAAAAILPEKVANEFTSVYYKVASKQPANLAQLYGADSEVSHTAGSTLVGLSGIAAAARSLPLANKPVATVATLDAMSTGAGGVVLVVAGSLEGAPFTQTFVLSLADGDKVGHFYCRNDIFRFIGAGEAAPAAAAPADVLVAPRAEPVQVASAGGVVGDVAGKPSKTNSPAALADVSAPNGHAAAEGDESDGYDSEEEGDEDDETETEDEEVATPNGVEAPASKSAALKAEEAPPTKPVPVPPVKEASAPAPAPTAAATTSAAENPSKKSAEVASGKTTPRNTVGKTDDGNSGATMPTPKPSVPAKPKTWASIVSTTSGGTAAATSGPASTAAATPPANAAVNSANMAPPNSGEASGNSKPDSSSSGPSYNTTSKGSYPGGHTGSHHQSNSHGSQHQNSNDNSGGGGWSSVDNGKRQSNSHHGHQGHDNGFQKVMPNGQYGHNSGFKHNQGRVYGPSAVIQLNTLPMDRAKDWRTLQQEFLAEFNSYGFPVRNVEVKSHKGLAFIEYQDQAGVRAAVSEWADGPRDKGNFKGIPLSVTEKRQRRPHMTGDGGLPARGGRGGMRGRGGGRGRGRGMPYSSNGGTGAHTASTPAPATSTF